MSNIEQRLKDACIGHPFAEIAWPHRLLHDALAEIERLKNMSEWQSIETAPKDGQEISLWVPVDGWLPYMRWEKDVWISNLFSWSGNDPTHWMPLPDPPEQDT